MLKKSLKILALGAGVALSADYAISQVLSTPPGSVKDTPVVNASASKKATGLPTILPTSLAEDKMEPDGEKIAAPKEIAITEKPHSAMGCDQCNSGMEWNAQLFLAGDGWKTRGDDDDNNNFGIRSGVNVGFGTGDDWGYQIGASLGGYDFHGREDGANDNKVEGQIFITTGAFKRATCNDPYTYGAVLDYQHATNWGEDGDVGINLFQLRGLVGYAVDECNEIGVWSNLRLNRDNAPNLSDELANTQIQALSQFNVYWKHYWCYGADTMCYIGAALEQPGEVVLGANGNVPLNDCVSLFGNVHYIVPSTHGGDSDGQDRFAEETWNVTFGFAYRLGGSRCNDSCGGRYLPLLPVADNGTFPVTAAHTGLE